MVCEPTFARTARALLPCILAALTTPCPAYAQNAQSGAQWVMEERTDDRWLMQRQQHRFTPFREIRQYTQLTTGTARGSTNTVRASFPAVISVLFTEFTTAADGRITRDTTVWRPQRDAQLAAGDTARSPESMFFDRLPLQSFRMPAARVWELVPVVRATPAPGAAWVDTIANSARDGEYSQSLEGIRRSRVLRDTTVQGRQLWIISDSAAVTVNEHYQEEELSIGARVTIERRGTGFTRGRYLFDPVNRLYIRRSDTTALVGSVTLKFPDGRTFTSPARFDRRRTMILHTPAEYAARQAALRGNLGLCGNLGAQGESDSATRCSSLASLLFRSQVGNGGEFDQPAQCSWRSRV
jgi:hypothetical protein